MPEPTVGLFATWNPPGAQPTVIMSSPDGLRTENRPTAKKSKSTIRIKETRIVNVRWYVLVNVWMVL